MHINKDAPKKMIMPFLKAIVILGTACSAKAAASGDCESDRGGALLVMWLICTSLCIFIPLFITKYINEKQGWCIRYPYVIAVTFGAIFGQVVFFNVIVKLLACS
ncbi:hypothetical protein [Salmonella enterica]|uniref:hypothetical protein n=1 Tax=Salmonella enterica TaxID=28901 RepID=UPI003BDAB8D3